MHLFLRSNFMQLREWTLRDSDKGAGVRKGTISAIFHAKRPAYLLLFHVHHETNLTVNCILDGVFVFFTDVRSEYRFYRGFPANEDAFLLPGRLPLVRADG